MEELNLDEEDLKLIYQSLLYYSGGSILNEDRRDRLNELEEMFARAIAHLGEINEG